MADRTPPHRSPHHSRIAEYSENPREYFLRPRKYYLGTKIPSPERSATPRKVRQKGCGRVGQTGTGLTCHATPSIGVWGCGVAAAGVASPRRFEVWQNGCRRILFRGSSPLLPSDIISS